MQVHPVLHLLRVVVLEALAPVVAEGVRKYAAVRVEAAAGYGGRLSAVCGLLHGLQALLGVLVPEVVGAVQGGGGGGATGTQGTNAHRERRCTSVSLV